MLFVPAELVACGTRCPLSSLLPSFRSVSVGWRMMRSRELDTLFRGLFDGSGREMWKFPERYENGKIDLHRLKLTVTITF
jgi:hypothetical protein